MQTCIQVINTYLLPCVILFVLKSVFVSRDKLRKSKYTTRSRITDYRSVGPVWITWLEHSKNIWLYSGRFAVFTFQYILLTLRIIIPVCSVFVTLIRQKIWHTCNAIAQCYWYTIYSFVDYVGFDGLIAYHSQMTEYSHAFYDTNFIVQCYHMSITWDNMCQMSKT